jgi:hypothetical protein
MKKNILSLFFCLAIALNVFGQSGTTGSLTWVLEDGTLTISGEGEMPDYDYYWNPIPWYEYRYSIETIDIKEGVTSIGVWAFQSCSSLTSVIIPKSVTNIESNAFSECHSLTSIAIPGGVTSIGNRAFENCNNLTSIDIPNSVTNIGEYAFLFCTSLQSITVEWTTPLVISTNAFERVNKRDCILNVPEGSLVAYQAANVWKAFFNDSDFEVNENGVLVGYFGNSSEMVIPDDLGITAIGYAFQSNNTITSVVIPGGVSSIGNAAFWDCHNLASIDIPNSVTNIGNNAFYNCHNLQSITVEWTTPLAISASVFSGINRFTCTLHVPEGSLAAYLAADVWKDFLTDFEVDENGVLVRYYGADGDVVIPGDLGITTIGYRAFSNTVTSVMIPSGVTRIENSAFANCTNLTSITIPESVTSIEESAFYYCTNLQSITVSWPTPLAISADVFEGLNKLNCTLIVPEGLEGVYLAADVWKGFLSDSEFEVDGNGLLIGYYGEGGAVVIPDDLGITAIGNRAFFIKNDLTSVVIPGGVISIENSAFEACYNLASIDIPNSVTSIGVWAFKSCSSLTSISIPKSVASIGWAAFAYCRNLQSITVEWLIPLAISYDVFERVNKRNCTLNVPEGSLTAYQASGVWKYFLDDFEFEVDNGVLVGYNGDGGDVVIPDNLGITAIGYDVFYNNNNNLTSVVIPDGVISIGSSAFANCYSLTSINIPNSVISIGSSAFAYCSSLTSVIIPESVTSIEYSTFYECHSLTSIAIPSGVTNIGRSAFFRCLNLQSITVEWPTPLPISADVFQGVNKRNCTLNVPEGSLEVYQATDVWKNFFFYSEYEINENGELIGYNGEGGDVVIPDNLGITTIGWAFKDDTNITSVVIPDGVSIIGWDAFSECSNLISVTISNDVTDIRGYAFINCSSLASITLSNRITSIEGWTFYGCSSLASITIPNSVTSIGYVAFGECSSLASITIPNSITSIGLDAFVYCSSLSNVEVQWANPLTISAEVFNGVDLNNLTLTVPIGTKSLYQTADVWKDFGSIVEKEQNIIADENEPAGANGIGKIDLSLTIPTDVAFTGTFKVELPDGLHLDVNATKLAGDLGLTLGLTITQNADGSWLFTITSNTLRSATETTYQKLVQIVYTVDESVADGSYEAIISDLELVFEDNTVIKKDEIPVNVTVDHTIITGIANPSLAATVRIQEGTLFVNSAANEQVSIYSVAGNLLYQAKKQAGEVRFSIGNTRRILIVKGSSGWVKKVY